MGYTYKGKGAEDCTKEELLSLLDLLAVSHIAQQEYLMNAEIKKLQHQIEILKECIRG